MKRDKFYVSWLVNDYVPHVHPFKRREIRLVGADHQAV